jgi:hypothetical protein
LLLCRFGRKFLLIQGGIQLTLCEIVVGILIAVGIGSSGMVSKGVPLGLWLGLWLGLGLVPHFSTPLANAILWQ